MSLNVQYKEIPMTLKEYLRKNNIPIEVIAVKCEISVSTLRHYFSGIRRPSIWTARRIEKFTRGEVTVEELRGADE